MGDQMAAWYKENGEYITGGLFGLVVLDIFMFLVHCLIERTTEGYNLTTLIITVGFLMVALFEKLYSEQEEAH